MSVDGCGEIKLPCQPVFNKMTTSTHPHIHTHHKTVKIVADPTHTSTHTFHTTAHNTHIVIKHILVNPVLHYILSLDLDLT